MTTTRATWSPWVVRLAIRCGVALAALGGVATGLLACASVGSVPPDSASEAEPPAEAPPEVVLRGADVYLDGAPLGRAPEGKMQKVVELSDVLFPRGLRLHAQGVWTYALRIEGPSDGAQMKSVVRTAAAAGWPVAGLLAGDSVVRVHAAGYSAARSPAAPGALEWPERVLTLVVRRGAVEVWRVPGPKAAAGGASPAGAGAPGAAGEAASPPGSGPTAAKESAPGAGAASAAPAADGAPGSGGAAQRLAASKVADVPAELPGLVEAACGQDACDPAILYVADDASAAVVGQSLAALAKVHGKRDQPLAVQLEFDDPAAEGSEPGAKARAGQPEPGSTSGRLSPQVIQQEVRRQFGHIRKCYEQGLLRNPHLTGTVAVRFLIGRDGKTSEVASYEWQTNLPDAKATKCVVDAFRTVVFPAPEGGIVTVVYPIMFSSSN